MLLKDMEPIVKKFYEGLEEGVYYARKCQECGAVEFPPHLACNTCGYHGTEWVEVSGHGKLLNEFQTAYVLPLHLGIFPEGEERTNAAEKPGTC